MVILTIPAGEMIGTTLPLASQFIFTAIRMRAGRAHSRGVCLRALRLSRWTDGPVQGRIEDRIAVRAEFLE
jgi:hypothetical protein